MPATIHHDAQAASRFLAEAEASRREQKKITRRRHLYLHVAGRVFLASLFIIGAIAKLLAFDDTAWAMERAGIATPGMMLTFAIIIEWVGGAFVLAGFKARATAVALFAYVVAVTLIVNGDIANEINRNMVLSNIGILGGLMMLWSHGAGTLSADTELAKRQARRYAA